MERVEGQKVAVLARPSGVCAGVNYAWYSARDWMKENGPMYILGGNMANNNLIVDDLEKRGGIAVESLEEVPPGADVARTAHGGPIQELEIVRDRGLRMVDFTCPLVGSVYNRFSRALENARVAGQTPDLIYLCKPDLKHREVAGVMTQFRDWLTVIPHEKPLDELDYNPSHYYAFDSQTTMNAQEVAEWVTKVKAKIPTIETPPVAGVCYATKNRQSALRRLLALQPDLVLVMGSTISSNTKELVKITQSEGFEAQLLETGDMVTEDLVRDRVVVGVTGGASVPMEQPLAAMDRLVAFGYRREEFTDATEPDYFADKLKPRVYDYRR